VRIRRSSSQKAWDVIPARREPSERSRADPLCFFRFPPSRERRFGPMPLRSLFRGVEQAGSLFDNTASDSILRKLRRTDISATIYKAPSVELSSNSVEYGHFSVRSPPLSASSFGPSFGPVFRRTQYQRRIVQGYQRIEQRVFQTAAISHEEPKARGTRDETRSRTSRTWRRLIRAHGGVTRSTNTGANR
jgi:hypothetical protein